jgi:hypothetical protein
MKKRLHWNSRLPTVATQNGFLQQIFSNRLGKISRLQLKTTSPSKVHAGVLAAEISISTMLIVLALAILVGSQWEIAMSAIGKRDSRLAWNWSTVKLLHTQTTTITVSFAPDCVDWLRALTYSFAWLTERYLWVFYRKCSYLF